MKFAHCFTVTLLASASLSAQTAIEEVDAVTPEHASYCNWFGTGIALEGERMLVGAYGRDSCGSAAQGPGSAFLFERQEDPWGKDRWSDEAELIPSDGLDEDLFGYSVALEGSRAFAGSPMHDTPREGAGAVYVYEHLGGAWVETFKLRSADPQRNALFGSALAAAGDRIVVGSKRADGAASRSGAAYVMRFDGTRWQNEQKLVASDGVTDDHFGGRVALLGDTALVASYVADAPSTDSGAVYVFALQAGQWTETQKITPAVPRQGGHFGAAIDLHPDRVWIGGSGGQGRAYLFERGAGPFLETQLLTSPDEAAQGFGRAIAEDGDRLLVTGGRYDDLGLVGTAHHFRRDAAGWRHEAELVTAEDTHRRGEAPQDFGLWAAAAEGRSYVTSPAAVTGDGQSAGNVYLYEGISGHALSDSLSPGEEFVHRNTGALPSSLLFLYVVDVNGTPSIQRVAVGTVRSSGTLRFRGPVPPSLSGNTFGFQSIGRSTSGEVSSSNVHFVEFR